MINEEKSEERSEEQVERRPYEAPTVRDFFQPLVVLGTANQFEQCATPKRPKH